MYILIYIYIYLLSGNFLFGIFHVSFLKSKYSIALEYIKCLVKHRRELCT